MLFGGKKSCRIFFNSCSCITRSSGSKSHNDNMCIFSFIDFHLPKDIVLLSTALSADGGGVTLNIRSEAVKVFMELDLMTSGEHFLEAELQHELSEHEATQAIAQAVREAEQAKSTQQQQHGETTERHRPALEAIGKLLTNAYNPLQQSVSGDRTQQQTTLPNELAVSQICSMGFKEDQVNNEMLF